MSDTSRLLWATLKRLTIQCGKYNKIGGKYQVYGVKWLPSPEIIRTVINKIISAFADAIQTKLIRVRWEEIKLLKGVIP